MRRWLLWYLNIDGDYQLIAVCDSEASLIRAMLDETALNPGRYRVR